MALLLELFELAVVLQGSFLEILGFHGELGFQLMDLSAIKFLETGQFMLESLILDRNVLILMEQVVNFELVFRNGDIFPAELVLKFDQFVLEFYPKFAFVVEIVFQFVLGVFELLPLVLEHKFHFGHVVIFGRVCIS